MIFESLLKSIQNSPISDEEKMQLIVDALYNAANANKGGIVLKTSIYQSPSTGRT